jgi:hypothetical protein
VAAFARAPVRRLLLAQLIVALLAGGAVAWFLREAWFPVISAAIAQLPATGEIRAGSLDWRGATPRLLADGRFLAFSVDMEHTGAARSPAHLQLEFGRASLFIHSLLGYAEARYPASWVIAANRAELEPLWGAWRPGLLAACVIGVAGFLLASWWTLAALYAGPVWLAGFYSDRDLRLRAAWKLAGAALLPGALVMTAGVAGYRAGALDLVGLGFVFSAHLALGWMYLATGLFVTPRRDSATKGGNPFASAGR